MTREASNLIQRRSLQEEILSRLREEIIEGIWEPGARLQERVLCERYGVSRSPLREACQVLASEGLLEIHRNRGVVVTRATMTDALENMELVIVLLALAIRLACDRASEEQLAEIEKLLNRMRKYSERHEIVPFFELNNEINHAIVKASGNSALLPIYENVDRHITRLQKLSGALRTDPAAEMGAHEEFINALLQRDAESATAALEAHLKSVTGMIKQRIEEED